jgi:hypothetical protein
MTPEEKIKLRNRLHYEKNKEKIKLKQKKWREDNVNYAKKYYDSNLDKFKEYGSSDKKKKYNKLNAEKRRETSKEWRKNNPNAHKEYYQLNKDRFNKNAKKHYEEKVKKDPLLKLKKNIRGLIRISIKNTGSCKINKTVEILGCTYQEFKEHLELQFEPWMNWSNYGAYKINGQRTWQIDHLLPMASAMTTEEVIKLNHYSNLRPLCSKENLSKGNKLF